MRALSHTLRNFYFPPAREWRAFALGVREFRLSFTTAFEDDDLALAYDCGRELTHLLTFRRFEVQA